MLIRAIVLSIIALFVALFQPKTARQITGGAQEPNGPCLYKLVAPDEAKIYAQIAEFCKKEEIGCIRAAEAGAGFVGPTVVVGEFAAECPTALIIQDTAALVAEYAESDRNEYLARLNECYKKYHGVQWLHFDTWTAIMRRSILPQYRLRRDFPDAFIAHIVGPTGSGKRLLAEELRGKGLHVINTDDITSGLAGRPMDDDYAASVFDRIRELLTKHRALVFCGSSVDLSFAADVRLILKTPTRDTYERMVRQSVDTICENHAKILAALDDHSMSTPEGYETLTAEIGLKAPALIAPRDYIDGDIIPRVEHWLADGYKLADAAEIVQNLPALFN